MGNSVPKRTKSHQPPVVETLHLVLVHLLVALLRVPPGPHKGVRARTQTLRKGGLACISIRGSQVSDLGVELSRGGAKKKEKSVLCSASSSSESASPSSLSSSSVEFLIVVEVDFCFRFDTLSNDLRTVPGPSLTPSATSEPRAIRLPSPTWTPAPMMQLSRTQLGPIVTSLKMYALRRTVAAPIEQRAPMVDVVTCASSCTRVEGPMSVLLPILHVLRAVSDDRGNFTMNPGTDRERTTELSLGTYLLPRR